MAFVFRIVQPYAEDLLPLTVAYLLLYIGQEQPFLCDVATGVFMMHAMQLVARYLTPTESRRTRLATTSVCDNPLKMCQP